jgi:hypothetical protein
VEVLKWRQLYSNASRNNIPVELAIVLGNAAPAEAA